MGIVIDDGNFCEDLARVLKECCHDFLCECCCSTGATGGTGPFWEPEGATGPPMLYVKEKGIIGINQEKLLEHIKAHSDLVQRNPQDTQS